MVTMNPQEQAFALARFAVERDLTEYVRREIGNPWLNLTINPITDKLEVWYDQPGREPYLVTQRRLVKGKGLQIPQLLMHIREIELSNETLAQRVERLERHNEGVRKAQLDEYLDQQVPVAERIHHLIDKEVQGFKARVF